MYTFHDTILHVRVCMSVCLGLHPLFEYDEQKAGGKKLWPNWTIIGLDSLLHEIRDQATVMGQEN